ncbi:hypothetical protein [uncultured Dokdonia sp.]|uniref:hypothetical protein n=1 Tax=uncultured Dokdonia sp. TaxID=575653 RepID=UPI00262A97F4|nr:hypothetical protein [uncultured Dokdonia sp.]
MSLILIVFLISVSCSNSRNSTPISIHQFEKDISTEKVERIIFHSDGAIEIKYLTGDELYQITTDTILPEGLKQHIGDILKKHNSQGIIFEEQIRFIDNFF